MLLLSLGGLGDFLTRWALWQSVRRSFPSARIEYLGLPRHGNFLCAVGLCDEVLDFNEARWSLPGALTGLYDCAISLLGARGREWMERLTGGRIGRVVEIEPFPREGAGVSVSGYVAAQALSMGFADPGPFQINLPLHVRAWADGFWSACGLRGKRVVAVHSGSGGESKNWPGDRFAELSARLAARGATVISLEGEAEEDLLRAGGRLRPAQAMLRIRNQELLRVAALLGRCEWYIGNDSGISHLAALQGAPSTVIFGPTDPALWAPWNGGNVTVVKRPAPCAPCTGKQRRECQERKCLTEIGVDEILGTIALT